MKIKLLSLFVLPFLIGCESKPIVVPKYQIEYNEKGTLITKDPEFLYNHSITDAIDAVYYIGDETCAACQKLKPQLEAWCEVNKGAIYYIPVSSITGDNMHYLVDATLGGPYEWQETSSVPCTYFFKEGYCGFCSHSDDTMTYLLKYVEVIVPENA